jgi:hypothetical protein
MEPCEAQPFLHADCTLAGTELALAHANNADHLAPGWVIVTGFFCYIFVAQS